MTYSEAFVDAEAALSLRLAFVHAARTELGIELDIVLLSDSEADQTDFVRLEGAMRINADRNLVNGSRCDASPQTHAPDLY